MSELWEIHSHVLCGMDDGPRTEKSAFALLDQAAARGISVIIATPHYTPGDEKFRWDAMRERIREANAYLEKKGCSLRVEGGCEILYSSPVSELLLNGAIPTLAGSKCVLVEFPLSASYTTMFRGIREIMNAGYIAILAHIERYECLHNHMERVKELHNTGCLFQMNCRPASKACRFGLISFPTRLLRQRQIDFVSSDAHDRKHRPFSLKKCHTLLKRRFGEEYANRLCGRNASRWLRMTENETSSSGENT